MSSIITVLHSNTANVLMDLATKATLNTVRGVHIYSVSKCKIKVCNNLCTIVIGIALYHM